MDCLSLNPMREIRAERFVAHGFSLMWRSPGREATFHYV